MQYFKNTDLAKIYPISEKAVRNWIKAAKNGQLDLVLHESEKRAYIANTSQNIAKIEKIIKERKKYTNKLTHKEVQPTDELYATYTEGEVFDIINSLEVHNEIPLQYSFFGEGAQSWEDYIQQQMKENVRSIPTATPKLFSLNLRYIDYVLEGYKRINIICIGAEVFTTLQPLFIHLSKQKMIGRVILIDTSPAMIALAKEKIDKWFGGRVELEAYKRDMRFERFHDILLHETLREDAVESLNLFFLVGSTIYNFQSPDETLKMIHHSLGSKDIFIHDVGLDTREKRGFNLSFGTNTALSPRIKMILDMLNVNDDYYIIEKSYDKKRKLRTIKARFNVAVTLKFRFGNKSRVVKFNKGDAIVVFRYWHKSAPDVLKMLNESGFQLLHASHTKGAECVMTISSVTHRG